MVLFYFLFNIKVFVLIVLNFVVDIWVVSGIFGGFGWCCFVVGWFGDLLDFFD